MTDLLATVYDVLEIAVPLAMLPVIAHHHRPHVAFAWIVVVWALPVLGTLAWLYLSMYRPRRQRERQKALEEVKALAEALPPAPAQGPHETGLGPEVAPLARLVERLGLGQIGGWPVVGGNRVEVLDEPGLFADRLLRDIDAAHRSVDLLFYLVADDGTGRRVAEALVAASRRGVRCRLLAGSYASHWESSKSFFQDLAPRLDEEGVEVHPLQPMNPLRRGLSRVDLRNHRKLAVMDGGVAGFVGSDNLHDPTMGLEEGLWHQLSVRIEGPAARHLELVFLHDWVEHGGRIDKPHEMAASEPASDGVPAQVVYWGAADDAPAVKALTGALGAVQERAVLTSPYFVPDRPLMIALATAALRGVEIDLVLPERSDRRIADAAARATFEELLEVGVRIHLHPSGLLHAKCLTLDDRVAIVGSANADRRSFYLDDEVVVLLYHPEPTLRVRARQEAWIKESRRLDLERFRARPRWRRTVDDVAALASPLL